MVGAVQGLLEAAGGDGRLEWLVRARALVSRREKDGERGFGAVGSKLEISCARASKEIIGESRDSHLEERLGQMLVELVRCSWGSVVTVRGR